MSFLDRWKEGGIGAALKGGETTSQVAPAQTTAQVAAQVVPTALPQASFVPATVSDLAETTKQAFVDEVAKQVPDLKKLLESAALIVEDVPDLPRRLSITAKQLRASGQFDVQKALSGLRQAINSMSQALQAEVAQEEAQNITTPTRQMEELETQRQALIRSAEALAEQAGTLRLRVATNQETLGRSKAKCEAGLAFMQGWQSQMEQLLGNLK